MYNVVSPCSASGDGRNAESRTLKTPSRQSRRRTALEAAPATGPSGINRWTIRCRRKAMGRSTFSKSAPRLVRGRLSCAVPPAIEVAQPPGRPC